MHPLLKLGCFLRKNANKHKGLHKQYSVCGVLCAYQFCSLGYNSLLLIAKLQRSNTEFLLK